MKNNIIHEIDELRKDRCIILNNEIAESNKNLSIEDKLKSAIKANHLLNTVLDIVRRYENK